MNKKKDFGLDFIVDKLTHSIENVVTGDSFATNILVVEKEDLKHVNKKNGWVFNWVNEFKRPERDIYKLTIVNNPNVIQGMISVQVKEDHVYMHLIESAGFNKGQGKMYSGVLGNLVAFACKLSFQRGYDGNVAFTAKTQLIEHYTNTLGAIHIGKNLMILDTKAALVLTNKYF